MVLHVLYLIFNEGYTDQLRAGAAAGRPDRRGHPAHPAAAPPAARRGRGRRAARADAADRRAPGAPAPTRTGRSCRWPSSAATCGTPPQIAEGVALLTRTLGTGPVGPYQLQAAIAAVHDEAPTAEETDWPQILALYDVLDQVAPGPVVTLNRAVALAMVHGPRAGLALLGTLDADERMAHTHRLEAVRGAPARAGRRHRRRPRVLPAGGEDDRERARAALPRPARGPTAPTPVDQPTRPADPPVSRIRPGPLRALGTA